MTLCPEIEDLSTQPSKHRIHQSSKKEKMNDLPADSLNAKKTFRECGTCSQTFGHILNREFGQKKEMEERALDLMAGGVLNTGHQCGMLWGATLAVGAESFRRHEDHDEAIALAVTATQHIVDSFINITNTVNCREITGYNLNSVFGLVKFMLKTMVKGMNNSPCFNLAEQWAPKAVQSAKEGLADESIHLTQKPISCASLVAKKMGATDEEAVMVAGFAGGMGLSGEGCGAVGAALWMIALAWCKAHPGKSPPYLNNPEARKLLKQFYAVTDSEMRCETICGRRFATINDYTEYIIEGGCEKVIEVLTGVA